MSKPIDGPFLVDGQTVYKLSDEDEPSNVFYATVEPCHCRCTTVEAKAIARLFAAAPELYRAACALDAVIDLGIPWRKGDLGIVDPSAVNAALRRLREALAAVQGP